jgi:8-oxo-dGTP pyrophosphatase MutT (NUDIX family)
MKKTFIKTLKSSLALAKLPGPITHDFMRPKLVSGSSQPYNRDVTKYNKASVLIALYQEHNTLFFPLIERTLDGGIHSGQISLPGGKLKTGENIFDGAIRETSEELGFDCQNILILGNLSLTPVIPSQFVVTPVVGYLKTRPQFNPCKKEVHHCFSIPLEEFLCRDNIKKTITPHREAIYEIPYFYLQEKMIWGATAMILYEFLTVIEKISTR